MFANTLTLVSTNSQNIVSVKWWKANTIFFCFFLNAAWFLSQKKLRKIGVCVIYSFFKYAFRCYIWNIINVSITGNNIINVNNNFINTNYINIINYYLYCYQRIIILYIFSIFLITKFNKLPLYLWRFLFRHVFTGLWI